MVFQTVTIKTCRIYSLKCCSSMTSGGKKYQAYEIRVLDPFSFCNSGFKDYKAAKSVIFSKKYWVIIIIVKICYPGKLAPVPACR